MVNIFCLYTLTGFVVVFNLIVDSAKINDILDIPEFVFLSNEYIFNLFLHYAFTLPSMILLEMPYMPF